MPQTKDGAIVRADDGYRAPGSGTRGDNDGSDDGKSDTHEYMQGDRSATGRVNASTGGQGLSSPIREASELEEGEVRSK